MAEGPAPHEFFQKSKIKSEDDDMSEEKHSHTFILNYPNSREKYTIHCDHPQTVLEAISCKNDWHEKLKCKEQNLTVQIGKASQGTAIATHFPCRLLETNELVTLTATNEQVVQRGAFDRTVSHNERYYVLNIQTKGGTNAKTKKLFRSSSIKKFAQLCVYGTRDMTIKDAIARDGRFVELSEFKLEDVTDTKSYVFSDDKIEAHKNKTFRICLEREKPKANTNPEKQSMEQKAAAKGQAQDASKVTPSAQESAKVRRLTEVLKTKEAKGENVEEVYERLRQQFPHLKKILENRYPENTLEETLEKVDFGKAQQSFSDVFRLEKLLKLGKSVGKLVVVGNMSGTAFVLCDRYIITNAHLFKEVMDDDNNLDPNVEVYVLFNYTNPVLQNTLHFTSHKMIDFDEEQDYAVLELDVPGQNKVPPGLMNLFCPMPESGEACIIGHPAGDVQKIDPTCIIGKEYRGKEVNDHLQRFKDNMFTHMSISQFIEKQGISRILSQSDPLYESASTYPTYMYHGSSGSPVFDAHCRVFGLHSGGFVYGMSPQTESVIEFSRPVLLIFEKFVTSLKNRGENEVLKVVKEHSKKHSYLKKILRKIVGSENREEPMDTS
ncbi:serine protease FAM111A-like [Periophthalmus magnuspinnatus]|uniref:serine protease FAM111A-like n=1 Tax=Periophthalmus magnuspinnatus TaxID=409849 RepID=UPI00145A8AEF|nr:serine protease FAM111A-like [Periophthalmus magnuspinnatus]